MAIRELDALVSEYVLGHQVIRQKKGGIKERTRLGHIRPLRSYSTDMTAAWEVVQNMGITLIPVSGGNWFALVGTGQGWNSPADLMEYLRAADFVNSGAAVARSAPFSICIAALKAVEKRQGVAFELLSTVEEPPEDVEGSGIAMH